MQVTTVAPTPPVPPLSPTAINIVGADGVQHTLVVPLTRREVSALRSQRNELSNQLTSAADRRHSLSEELKTAPAGPSRTGLEQRIEVLDKRMVQLESDIATTGQQLSAAPRSAITGADDFGNARDIPRNVMQISGMFIVFVLFPIVLTLSRFIWKKSTNSSAPQRQQVSGETDKRLERLEHGVDAIAIEMERVSEGQRFVTRLLSEGQPGRVPMAVSEGVQESIDRS
ncbi:MAG: hypothetical protein ABIZ36_06695 [Gemmatimonadaceae bacterium]